MAKFFVGQRVRIVRPHPLSPERNKSIGKECIVLSINKQGRIIRTQQLYIGIEVNIPNEFYSSSICDPSQLEPILDRPETVEWSACAWSPHRAGVVS